MITPAEWWRRRQFRASCFRPAVRLEHWDAYGLRAGFTTRHFPLYLKTSGELDLLYNQESFTKHFPVSAGLGGGLDRFVVLDQIHEVRVAVVQDDSAFGPKKFLHIPKTDGVLTPLENITLLVMTADCLPIFLHAAGENGSWIGLVHAGWRGTQKQVADKAFHMIADKAQCRPQDIHIAFGPCISQDRYEVGNEFKDFFPSSALRRADRKLYFDLAGENRRQLLKAGAQRSKIWDPAICTVGQNRDFYSFRFEQHKAGRMASFITKLGSVVK